MGGESKTRMTEGSISKKIILFAIPLFLGNLFQQLYNTADSLIVGNFLGSNALAAVSSSGNLIFLMVGTKWICSCFSCLFMLYYHPLQNPKNQGRTRVSPISGVRSYTYCICLPRHSSNVHASMAA